MMSLDALHTWVLHRSWYEPVKKVKRRVRPPADPDAWVSAGIPPKVPGWRPCPLPEDDPAIYAGFLDRMDPPIDMDDAETVSLSSVDGE